MVIIIIVVIIIIIVGVFELFFCFLPRSLQFASGGFLLPSEVFYFFISSNINYSLKQMREMILKDY